jgi:hypothetical protein
MIKHTKSSSASSDFWIAWSRDTIPTYKNNKKKLQIRIQNITPPKSIEIEEKMKRELTIFWFWSISLTVFDLFQKFKLSLLSRKISKVEIEIEWIIPKSG